MLALIHNTDEQSGAELPRFSCRSVPKAGCVHVVPRGELDIATVPHLDRSLRIAREAEEDVVLDLRELDFIDSSGGHLLVEADRRIRESGGRLLVYLRSGEVAWLLQLLGIDRMLHVELSASDTATVHAWTGPALRLA